jgi:NitT/TauT family transport system permease protein
MAIQDTSKARAAKRPGPYKEGGGGPRGGPRAKGSRSDRAGVALAIAFPAVILIWWWTASQNASPLVLPQPDVVLRSAVDMLFGSLAVHTWTSMARIVAALVLALVAGGLLVFLARLVPATRIVVEEQILPFLNSVPALGWAILGVFWLGIGNLAVVLVVALIILPFCMVNIAEGLRSLDPGLLEMGRSFTRSRFAVLTKIQIPLLMPYVFAAVRLSFSVGWKVALIAEFFGARSGLGLIMNRARQNFDTPTVFATVVVVLVIVLFVERLVFDPLSRTFARRSGTGGVR